MITDAILTLLSWILNAGLDLIPDTEPPAWIESAGGFLRSTLGIASSMGVWIPWNLLGIVLAAVLLANVAGFGVKAVRIIISTFTGGGGSAA